MSIVYTWNVSTLETAKLENGLSDVIKQIHWRLTATDETRNVEVIGTVALEEPDSNNFISFESLTESQVITWVESKLDVVKLKESLREQLDLLKNPPIVIKQGPWIRS